MDEDELLLKIMYDWNFFKIDEDEADLKFAVCKYDVEDMHKLDYVKVPVYKVEITGRSPLRTFKEHQDLLRKEFE